MDLPPIYSRQPPDGHEFPDYKEDVDSKPPPIKPREVWKSKQEPPRNGVKDKIAIFSNKPPALTKRFASVDNVSVDVGNGFDKRNDPIEINDGKVTKETKIYRTSATITPYVGPRTRSTIDLRDEVRHPRLVGRSLSLSDVSGKQDKWNNLVEQRRKCMSRLKGLVIPENIPEIETGVQPFVDLPEIRSDVKLYFNVGKDDKTVAPKQELKIDHRHSSYTPAKLPSQTSTPLKRTQKVKTPDGYQYDEKSQNLPELYSKFNEAPKSLESITSPTRSDYSFEYIYSPDVRKTTNGINERRHHHVEDESDNDSALSSSQSSYVSRNSPPASPTNTLNHDKRSEGYDSSSRRLLKPQSVEAINRKNILASARCRSGRDLKVGSPLIQRKFDDDDDGNEDNKNVQEDTLKEDNRNEETNEENAIEKRDVLKEDAPVVVVVQDKPQQSEPEIIKETNSSILTNAEIAKPSPIQSTVEVKPIPRLQQEFNVVIRRTTDTTRANLKNNDVPVKTVRTNVQTWKKTDVGELKETNKNLVPKQSPRSFGFAKAASVNDLRKNFEKETPKPSPRNSIGNAPEEPKPLKRFLTQQLPTNSVVIKNEESTQDLEKIKKDVKEEYGGTIQENDLKIVFLKPDVSGGSIGITLAGGSDYEIKEITIHKIRTRSPAHRDGTLQKGDRILMINGKTMKGVSHAQSLKILKENVSEVVVVACTVKENENPSPAVVSPRRQSSLEFPKRPVSVDLSPVNVETPTRPGTEVIEVKLIKDIAGLGFSIQGGHDSPQGDVPLIIKKLFVGGAAEKSSKLQPGDELLEINGTDLSGFSRIDAWNLMKKIPDGEVVIRVRR